MQREVLTRLQEQDISLVKECPACGACYDSAVETCADDGTELQLSVPVERTVRDRYRLDRVLGKGGIGAVYKGVDLRLNRQVAVKVLLGAVLDKPEVQMRFEREARVIAQLSHPQHRHRLRLRPDGGGQRLHRPRAVTGDDAALVVPPLRGAGAGGGRRVARPVLEGLSAAHRKGVIHRDLKPGNVFLVKKAGGEQVVKLLDFGIAKIKPGVGKSRHLTIPGVVLGTVGYMAPEQVLGGEIDERTDIYSIGVLVTEALLGHAAVQGLDADGRAAVAVRDPDRAALRLPGGGRARPGPPARDGAQPRRPLPHGPFAAGRP